MRGERDAESAGGAADEVQTTLGVLHAASPRRPRPQLGSCVVPLLGGWFYLKMAAWLVCVVFQGLLVRSGVDCAVGRGLHRPSLAAH